MISAHSLTVRKSFQLKPLLLLRMVLLLNLLKKGSQNSITMRKDLLHKGTRDKGTRVLITRITIIKPRQFFAKTLLRVPNALTVRSASLPTERQSLTLSHRNLNLHPIFRTGLT